MGLHDLSEGAGEAIRASRASLERYLSEVHGRRVEVLSIRELGKEKEEEELKGFGYGVPYLIEFKVEGEVKEAVLETIKPGGFGHEHFSDRAQILLWQHSAFNKLLKHVRSIDVGAFTKDGGLKALGDCVEFFLLTEAVKGTLYHVDLDRIKGSGRLTQLDKERCLTLSNYLVDVHAIKGPPELYIRRVRDLIGHGECIMGLIDSYPSKLNFTSEEELMKIERKCVEWRWKLKHMAHRCSRVHGDVHPWNILFREGTDFTILDRSRGEWGEPADDISAMSINYIFYGLQAYEKLAGPFEELYNLFIGNYIQCTNDEEIFKVIQPFYAWRGLVIASPIWYPSLTYNVRRKLFNFILNVLDEEIFQPDRINEYLEQSI